MEAIQRGLAVMDATALTLCMENRLPIHVFNVDDPTTSAGSSQASETRRRR